MKRLWRLAAVLGWGIVAILAVAAPTYAQPVSPARPPQRDYAAELARLRPLADSGDAEAQFRLGILYCRGFGVPRDLVECNRLYRLAAEHGNANAQYTLGSQYMAGFNGLPRDPVQANRWFRLAADGGNNSAQYMLGINYSTGLGVKRDDAEAVRLLRKSADQNNLMAIVMLADMIEHNRGGPPNPAEATRLWRLAALKGYTPANDHLKHLDAVATVDAMPKVAGTFTVPLIRKNNLWIVEATIDDAVNVNFILDSGASVTSFPASVAQLLGLMSLPEARSGVTHAVQFADGSAAQARAFPLRAVRVGGKTIPNVVVTIFPGRGTPLLGQSFLQMFRSWSIDNERQLLVLTEKSQ